jgi:hypothetical protein
MQMELARASLWITSKWFDSQVSNGHPVTKNVASAEYGAFEGNLAEAIVLDHGADFLFAKWGAEMGILCGGDHRGHRLSTLPQPSRSQLRRVCVRAMAGRAPVLKETIWAVDGQIWECVILGLPIAGSNSSPTRILLALLFAPHPMLDGPAIQDQGPLAKTGGSVPPPFRK